MDFKTSPELAKRIERFESDTGHELIVVAAKKSDPYPGATWRGALVLTLPVAAGVLQFYEFHPRILETAFFALTMLVMAALIKYSGLQKFFVTDVEAERETSEKAAQFFSKFQSKSTGHEASILLFVSMEEHKIHLLVDQDLNKKLSQEDLNETVALLIPHFKAQHFEGGLTAAIETLQNKILSKAGKHTNPPQLNVENRVFWIEETP